MGFYSDKDIKKTETYNSSLECNTNQNKCVSEEEKTPFLQSKYEDGPNSLTEIFKISGRNELEIIVVMDVSGSMDDNLRKTGENMEAMLSHVQDKVWRMVFITADHGDHGENTKLAERWQDYKGVTPRFGKLMPLERRELILNQFILTKDTPEYRQIFRDTLTMENSEDCDRPPYCHAGNNEQPLRSLKATISRYKTNSDPQIKRFFQPNTDTVALLVTDEDERRDDFVNATTAEQVIQTYEKVFEGQNKRLFGFSISVQDKRCYQTESEGGLFGNAVAYGHIIGRLAELTGGINVSICEKNYGSSLVGISKVIKPLMQSLALQELFVRPETVKVVLNPNQPHVSWRLFGRKIRFSHPLEPDTKVTVHYRYE